MGEQVCNVDNSESIINDSENKSSKNRFNRFFKVALWPILYCVLIIAVCISAVYIFKNYYYSPVYINGESMAPTLDGKDLSNCDYGIVDKHTVALKNIKRYQIVTTHYPTEGDRLMIKRVLFIPGDTFSVVNNEMRLFESPTSSNYKVLDPSPYFERTITSGYKNNYKKTTLASDEYFVAGDNWSNSHDCFDLRQPITFEYLVGVVVEIQGKCTVNPTTFEVVEKRPGTKKYFNGVDF